MFIAYYLHWPLEEIFGLSHADRNRVIEEIGRIHGRDGAGDSADSGSGSW